VLCELINDLNHILLLENILPLDVHLLIDVVKCYIFELFLHNCGDEISELGPLVNDFVELLVCVDQDEEPLLFQLHHALKEELLRVLIRLI
jgi:hypothetical protein